MDDTSGRDPRESHPSPPSDSIKPFRIAPFGARLRRRSSDVFGSVIGYLIVVDGPMEYLVRTKTGRELIPVHLAVPFRAARSPVPGAKRAGSPSIPAAFVGGRPGQYPPGES